MSIRRLALVGLAPLAVALLLGGCSDDPEPRFAEPTSSASPTEADDTTPAAQEQTAEEFIREWVKLDAQMQNTGETEAYLAVSSRCSSCRDFADRVSEVYAKGGHISTSGWRVRSIHAGQNGRYEVEVDSRPTTVVEGTGKERRYAGGRATYALVLDESPDGWQVKDWYEVAS